MPLAACTAAQGEVKLVPSTLAVHGAESRVLQIMQIKKIQKNVQELIHKAEGSSRDVWQNRALRPVHRECLNKLCFKAMSA